MPGGGSGEFQGEKYFSCSDGHGLFFPVEKLKRDDRFGSPIDPATVKELEEDSEKDKARSTAEMPNTGLSPVGGDRVQASQSQSLEPTLEPIIAKNKPGRSQSLGNTPVSSNPLSPLRRPTGPFQLLHELLG